MFLQPSILRQTDPYGDNHSNLNIKIADIAAYGDVCVHGIEGVKFILSSGAELYWWIGSLKQTLKAITDIELALGIITYDEWSTEALNQELSDAE